MPVQSMWQLRLTDSVLKGFRVRRQVSVPTVNLRKVSAVDEKDVDATIKAMKEAGDEAFVVGYVEAGEKGVTLC